MLPMENINPKIETEENPDLLKEEITIEAEIMGKCCQTAEEKTAWVEKNGKRFREIVEEPEIIELINTNRAKAIEEIEKRLKEGKEK